MAALNTSYTHIYIWSTYVHLPREASKTLNPTSENKENKLGNRDKVSRMGTCRGYLSSSIAVVEVASSRSAVADAVGLAVVIFVTVALMP